eukprot:CFRG5724T1
MQEHYYTHGHLIITTAVSEALDKCGIKHSLVAGFRVRKWEPSEGGDVQHEAKSHTWIEDSKGRIFDLSCDFLPFIRSAIDGCVNLSQLSEFREHMNSKKDELGDECVHEVLNKSGIPPIGCVTVRGVCATLPLPTRRTSDKSVSIGDHLNGHGGRLEYLFFPKPASNGDIDPATFLPELPGLEMVSDELTVGELESVLLSRDMYKRLINPEVKLRIYEPVANLGLNPL